MTPARQRFADFHELERILEAHGYRRIDAVRLAGEGMGPFDLEQRLRVRPGDVGSIEFTHGIHKVSPKRRTMHRRPR